MALKKETSIDQITADEYGRLMIRERTDVVEDGEVVSSTYHRRIIEPGDTLSGLDPRLTAIAKAARKDAKPLPKA